MPDSTTAAATQPDCSATSGTAAYDAILVVSFGGPEHPDHVMPFLENVLRGRNVPRERMLEVAEHYYHFNGISPINQQVRDLIAALRVELPRHNVNLPIYWGNRNWHPMLPDTMQQMTNDGIRKAIAFVTSGFSSYSGCRQYREDVIRAREQIGETAPAVDKIRVFYNHPDFIAVSTENLLSQINQFPQNERGSVHVAFTAHSIPSSMAGGCRYEQQLNETARLVAEAAGLRRDQYAMVYQSRSGRPEDPWLEPDICDHVRDLAQKGITRLVIAPIGFLSDHMEVMYDLDDEARKVSDSVGIRMHRAATPGHHPRFVSMVAELISERVNGVSTRSAIGMYPANHDVCPLDCCPAPQRPQRPAAAQDGAGSQRPAGTGGGRPA